MAIKISELELTSGIHSIARVSGYTTARILVRWRGRPVGWVSVPIEGGQAELPAASIRAAVTEQLGLQLLPLVFGQADATPRPPAHTQLPPISVVICTRDRAGQLRSCLEAVLALVYPFFEVIVVDNASLTDDTAAVAASYPVRYVREDTPGLDWARNRGVAEARHDIIAFIDDDAKPDAGWLQAIAMAFATSDAAAVTGLVAPFELETISQIRFELEYGGMGHGFARRAYRNVDLSSDGLLWASGFGVGTNMAFRRALFDRIGAFDTALDVGTPSAGGGDVEMFQRVVAHGYTLLYEPAALVWHTHRRSAASLRRLIFNNGTSFGAYLLTCARNRSVSRPAITSFLIRRWLGWWLLRRLCRPDGFPRHLVVIELLGALLSGMAYARSRRRQRAATTARARLVGPGPVYLEAHA